MMAGMETDRVALAHAGELGAARPGEPPAAALSAASVENRAALPG